MRILVVPGLGGSGPDYWQSHWQRFGFWPTGERILDELVSEREVRVHDRTKKLTRAPCSTGASRPQAQSGGLDRHGCFAQLKTTKPDHIGLILLSMLHPVLARE